MKIFRENSQATRNRFFSDPLIKYIWERFFINESSGIVANYLRKLRSNPDYGKELVERLVQDMTEMENACNVTLLPDIAKKTEDIQAFSNKEEYDFLLQHGMHNKKQRQKVSD